MDRPGHKVPFRDAQNCHAEHRRLRVQRSARSTVIATVNSWAICQSSQENHTDPAHIICATFRSLLAAHNVALDGLQRRGGGLHNRRSRTPRCPGPARVGEHRTPGQWTI